MYICLFITNVTKTEQTSVQNRPEMGRRGVMVLRASLTPNTEPRQGTCPMPASFHLNFKNLVFYPLFCPFTSFYLTETLHPPP